MILENTLLKPESQFDPLQVVTHCPRFCYLMVELPDPSSTGAKPWLEPVDNCSFPITNLEVDYWYPNLQM